MLDYPNAPIMMRMSGEIDAYPGNIKEWEADHPNELASEEINALFGIGSHFHIAFDFYIDGVDENTARFPPGWRDRATVKIFKDDAKEIQVVAPCLDDLIVSKLHRLDPKDKAFIRACQQIQPLNIALIGLRLEESKPELSILANARGFLDALSVVPA